MRQAQFIHMQGYRLHAHDTYKRKKTVLIEKCWGVRDVVAEAMRVPEASRHVPNPEPPHIFRYRSPVDDPNDYPDWIEEHMGYCRESDGARLRKSAIALATYIVSLPSELKDLTPECMRLSAEFLQEMLENSGVDLTFGIRHLDESNPHIHFWATPSMASIEKQSWRLSPVVSLSSPELTKFQDLYWQKVGRKLGLARRSISPTLQRVNRWVYDKIKRNDPVSLKELVSGEPLYELGYVQAIQELIKKGLITELSATEILERNYPEFVNPFKESLKTGNLYIPQSLEFKPDI
ncbi:plasmid recombination protein [Vogesella sp. XCS3]|uniref:plasmid recombination protein n=1 Tax=Vogesella sp. XCS3 TaxID=2877939 RepID=UPI001D0B45E3|nr:plasmid recombination protein [Vogesella sp. XCS3]UDM18960.1 plasmid recombination protein [Vogesella sp. XCS3]